MQKHRQRPDPSSGRHARRTPFPRRGGPLLRTALEALESRRVLSALAGNQPPVIAAIADQLVAPGTQFTIQVVAHDSETPADRLTFSLAPGSSAHAQIDSTTGLLRFSAPTSEGVEAVIIVVSDDGSPQQSATERFDVVVSSVGFAGLAAQPVGAVRPDLPSVDRQPGLVLASGQADEQAPRAVADIPLVLPAPRSPLAEIGVPQISESMAAAARGRVTVHRPEIPEPEAPQPNQEPEPDEPRAPQERAPSSPGSPSHVPQSNAPAAAALAAQAAVEVPTAGQPDQESRDARDGDGDESCTTHAATVLVAEERMADGAQNLEGSACVPAGVPSLAVADGELTARAAVFAGPDMHALWRRGKQLPSLATVWEQQTSPRPPEAVLQSALLLACAPLKRGAVPLGPARGRRLGRFERLARV